MITYRSPRPQVEQLTDLGALCIQADFSTDDGVYAAAQELQDKCPILNSIVHNASSWFTDPGGRQNLDHLALMMRVHVGAPMVLTEMLVPALLGSDNPSVIHLSDHVANRGSDQPSYAAQECDAESPKNQAKICGIPSLHCVRHSLNFVMKMTRHIASVQLLKAR